MTVPVCVTCGTSYPDRPQPPVTCPICTDARQFVPRTGQAWTDPARLARDHANAWRALEPGLFEIRTVPAFGIDQRALLIRTPAGNLLWDCIALLDEATEAIIRALGGLAGIAISHPHYYTRCQDWAAAFGAPVHLHAADRVWLMRSHSAIRFWSGDSLDLGQGMTLLNLGGHFPGGTVLHWAAGADGAGALLSGDIVQVAPDTTQVSFQWSYPNMLPLPAKTVRRIADRLQRWPFARIYGAFAGREVMADGHAVVARSADRYVALLDGDT